MQVTTLGIDLAKNVFQVHGCDANGKPALRKQLARRQLLNFMAKLPQCIVAMEACASAHYWAHEIEKLGHQVRLIAPRLVRPFVKANKSLWSDRLRFAACVDYAFANRDRRNWVTMLSITHKYCPAVSLDPKIILVDSTI